jgi:hypothetical protein
MPLEIPPYRKHRLHTDFVTNIPLDPAGFKSYLAQGLGASVPQLPGPQELSLLEEFIK